MTFFRSLLLICKTNAIFAFSVQYSALRVVVKNWHIVEMLLFGNVASLWSQRSDTFCDQASTHLPTWLWSWHVFVSSDFHQVYVMSFDTGPQRQMEKPKWQTILFTNLCNFHCCGQRPWADLETDHLCTFWINFAPEWLEKKEKLLTKAFKSS